MVKFYNPRVVLMEGDLPGFKSLGRRYRLRIAHTVASLALAICTLMASQAATADSIREQFVQPSHYTGQQQMFGHAVDLHHDRMIVGAPRTLGTGDVYIYNRDGQGNWPEEARLLPPSDAQNITRFGKSVALIAGYAFVGADATIQIPGSNFWDLPSLHIGAVFVYQNNGGSQWNYVNRFLSSSSTSEDYAHSIDAERDNESYRLVVGAPLRKDTQLQRITGAAYVYTPTRNPFSFASAFTSQVIVPSIPPPASTFSDPEADSMQFGYDVDILGDRVLIGAPGWYDSNGLKSQNGRAYLYEKITLGLQPGWTEKQQLDLLGGSRNHQYGHSVALQATRAVVGNPCGDARGCGEAHVFELNANSDIFSHSDDLVPFNRFSNAVHYGSAVAMNGIRILVGAENGDAYLFKRVAADEWNRLETWRQGVHPIWTSESSSIAINDLFAVVGRKYDEINRWNSSSTDTGRAEVRRLDENLFLPEFKIPCREPLICRLLDLNK